ncbi:MAG: type II and III secretion system protein family protein [Pseudomonadales bacterium]
MELAKEDPMISDWGYSMTGRNWQQIGGTLVLCLLMWLPAQVSFAEIAGEVPGSSVGIEPGLADALIVPLYKSRVLQLSAPASRISVGNPDVADILIVRASQLYVLGKDLGTTNVHLWNRRDELIGTVSVEVTHDIESLKQKLFQLLPGEPIEVFSIQRSIALRGRVSSIANMEAALRMADAYLAQLQTSEDVAQFEQQNKSRREDATVGQVINLMEVGGGQQVMLEVKVAEISRTELKRMNAQFNVLGIGDDKWDVGGVNGGATFPDVIFENGRFPVPQSNNNNAVNRLVGDPFPDGTGLTNVMAIDEFAPSPMTIQDQGLFASFLSNSTLFNFALDIAKENGLAKILAEPTLTTLTGQEATFLSGGEFPIPVPRGDDGVTVVFKEFGVGLKFLPVVLAPEVINVKLDITVSELINSNTIGISTPETTATFLIPSLSKRSANATVELREGQTIGIAGLINENLREIVTKFPGLGELPVLGPLFRSQEFVNNETELLILVTPRIAKAIAPDKIKLPTDNFIEPSDMDFYLMGRLEGRPAKEDASTGGTIEGPTQGGTDTSYGHQVN